MSFDKVPDFFWFELSDLIIKVINRGNLGIKNGRVVVKGFDENASPYIWSYVINNNKGEILLDETNEKIDALKIQERSSFSWVILMQE